MYKKVLQLPTVTVSNQSFCIIIHQQGQWQHHFPHSNLLRNTVIIKEYAGGPQPHQRPLRKKTWHKYTSQNIEHATQRIGNSTLDSLTSICFSLLFFPKVRLTGCFKWQNFDGLFLLAMMNPSKSHHFQHSLVIKGYPYWLHEKASFFVKRHKALQSVMALNFETASLPHPSNSSTHPSSIIHGPSSP